MDKKVEFGIEISDRVLNSNVPKKIKRYYEVKNTPVIKSNISKKKVYRYRPGVNSFMIGDLDV